MTNYKMLVRTIATISKIDNIYYNSMSVKDCRKFLRDCKKGLYGEVALREYEKI